MQKVHCASTNTPSYLIPPVKEIKNLELHCLPGYTPKLTIDKISRGCQVIFSEKQLQGQMLSNTLRAEHSGSTVLESTIL